MKLSICTAGLCALAFVGAGCGDDNDTLSYDDTGTEISALCDKVDPNALNGEPKHDAPILAEIVPTFEDAIQEVEDLDVNEELEADRDAFVENANEQLVLIKEGQAAAEAGDKKEYHQKFSETDPLDKESDEIASRLGATGCIEG